MQQKTKSRENTLMKYNLSIEDLVKPHDPTGEEVEPVKEHHTKETHDVVNLQGQIFFQCRLFPSLEKASCFIATSRCRGAHPKHTWTLTNKVAKE